MRKIILFLILFTNLGFSIQSIRIAALRVEFQVDTNPLTTGDGTFMIDTVTADPFAIDPAPHDRTYFNDQIIAASNYFRNVSAGKVEITGTVYPKGLNNAYVLPERMGYYNPAVGGDIIDQRLSQLFIDAIERMDHVRRRRAKHLGPGRRLPGR